LNWINSFVSIDKLFAFVKCFDKKLAPITSFIGAIGA